jgi:hypothetical protein
MKIKWPSLTTTLLTLMVGSIAFYEIRDTFNGYKKNFFIRWFWNHLEFAQALEVKTYLLTDDQVKEMLERKFRIFFHFKITKFPIDLRDFFIKKSCPPKN